MSYQGSEYGAPKPQWKGMAMILDSFDKHMEDKNEELIKQGLCGKSVRATAFTGKRDASAICDDTDQEKGLGTQMEEFLQSSQFSMSQDESEEGGEE